MAKKFFICILFALIALQSSVTATPKQSDNKRELNNIFLEASYLYWYAGEDGLSLGRSGNFLIGDDPFLLTSNTLLSQPFRYHSGFKVGTGWRKNSWSIAFDYTWVRNSSSQSISAPNLNPNLGTGVWVIAPWFLQIANDGGSLSGIHLNSKWSLSLDLTDLTLSHTYCQYSRLAITPLAGLRAAFIRQKLNLELTETPGILISLSPQPIHSWNYSNSWAIGPRFGSNALLKLVDGFGVNGKIALSLLFTNYTTIFHKEQQASASSFPEGNIYAIIRNQATLRPVLECGLGLKWEKRFRNNSYLSLSADYDFMLWWNQNMIREMLNSMWNEAPINGNLYLYGPTFSVSFVF